MSRCSTPHGGIKSFNRNLIASNKSFVIIVLEKSPFTYDTLVKTARTCVMMLDMISCLERQDLKRSSNT